MADDARREKALRELVAAGESMADDIEDYATRRASQRAEPPYHPDSDRFREALAELRHLGVVPW